MALHEFAFKGVGPRWIRGRFHPLVILMSVAASAIPALVHAQVTVPFSANVPFTNTAQVATYVVNLGTLPLRPEHVALIREAMNGVTREGTSSVLVPASTSASSTQRTRLESAHTAGDFSAAS